MSWKIKSTTSNSGDRRIFIAGLAAAGFGAFRCSGAARFGSALAQIRAFVKSRLVDVHHHFVPPFYLAENRERITASGGGRINQAIAAMDEQGVATAILSLTTPGVWFGDAKAAAQTARRANEYAAALARNHPGRFGLFAATPLPDTDSSLREIEYAFNVLKADGIGLLTSYGDKWLGDAVYQAVFEELNRRKAVVFVHPTTSLCCRTLLPDVSPSVADIPQDTTRAVTNLLFTGAFAKFKDIRFIFTHAGGGRTHDTWSNAPICSQEYFGNCA